MSDKKKIIFVAFVGGRCGSSMTMGILDRCGCNCGPDADRSQSVENPGGFYEIESIQSLWRKESSWLITKPFEEPFSFDQIRQNVDAKQELVRIFENEYENRYPVVVKAMDFACVAMFENDPEYDIRVVCPMRNITDQCRSIARMWGTEYTIDCFKPWLTKMYYWMEAYKREFHFRYLDVDFNELLDNPKEQIDRIAEFCGLENTCGEWVKPEYSRSRL